MSVPLVAACIACLVGVCTLAGVLVALGAWKQRHLDLERRHGELAAEVRPVLSRQEARMQALEVSGARLAANVENLSAGVERIEGTVNRTAASVEAIAEKLAST